MNIYKFGNLGMSDLGWLESHFHFSFSSYFNPQRMSYGVLRVINDDIIEPMCGFPTHPHENMEIFTYVINGELSHKDSMGTEETLYAGDVQYMSAGTGITHSEYNNSKTPLRLLQIWIEPDRDGHTPNYGSKRIALQDREDKWLHIVSPYGGNGIIHINQDANFFGRIATKTEEIGFTLDNQRQAYVVLIDGEGTMEGQSLTKGDGVETERSFIMEVKEGSHFLVIEMAESL